jgi:ABC-type glycerol-3-phosphate transport system substrate-binding protein
VEHAATWRPLSRRVFVLSILAGVSTIPVAAAAGCGRQGTQPAPAPKQRIELMIWHNWGVPDPRTDYTEQVLLPRFAAEHPGLSAKIEFAGNGLAVLEKIKTNVAAGTPPDASFVYAEWTVALGQASAIVALDALMAAEKAFEKSDFYPHLWEALTYNGKI